MLRALCVLSIAASLSSCSHSETSATILLRRDIPASGSMSESFVVARTDLYAVQITYKYSVATRGGRARAWEAVGGVDQGAAFDVRLRLVRDDGKGRPIYDQLVSRPRLTSWGEGELHAELMRADLRPAKYLIEVQLVNGAMPTGLDASFDVVKAYSGK